MKTESPEFETLTRSPAGTHALGRKIGKALSTGMVITLTGDLGSGKTAFVQGLARGLGVPDDYYITSPTYTIINEYPGRYPLFHLDLYRISDARSVEDIGLLDLLHLENVVAIEWPEIILPELPRDFIALHFEILNRTTRKISIYTYGLNGKSVIQKLGVVETSGAESKA
ncbi:MAG: tRNA (adenosine(37)-N6)-threonylcarbamoyltransferase complex ATPase subunit type 1 TsaE [Pseudomonadota bacterium]